MNCISVTHTHAAAGLVSAVSSCDSKIQAVMYLAVLTQSLIYQCCEFSESSVKPPQKYDRQQSV